MFSLRYFLSLNVSQVLQYLPSITDKLVPSKCVMSCFPSNQALNFDPFKLLRKWVNLQVMVNSFVKCCLCDCFIYVTLHNCFIWATLEFLSSLDVFVFFNQEDCVALSGIPCSWIFNWTSAVQLKEWINSWLRKKLTFLRGLLGTWTELHTLLYIGRKEQARKRSEPSITWVVGQEVIDKLLNKLQTPCI